MPLPRRGMWRDDDRTPVQSPSPFFRRNNVSNSTTRTENDNGNGLGQTGAGTRAENVEKKKNFFLAFVEQETKSEWKEREGKKRRCAKLDE